MTTRRIDKGSFTIIEKGAATLVWMFQFNPANRLIGHNVNYNLTTPPGSALPTASFKNIDGPTFSLQFLLDATENYSAAREGVRADKAFLESLVQPSIEEYLRELNQFTAPPEVRYTMGGDSFQVLVTKCGFRDARFNNKGFETRTFVDLELQMYMADPRLLTARLERLKRLYSMVTKDTKTVGG